MTSMEQISGMFALKQVGSIFLEFLCTNLNCSAGFLFLYIYFKILFNILGMFAIRAERDYVIEEDFMKAVRKVADNKKLETKLDYKPV